MEPNPDEIERLALVIAIRAHPEWLLADLLNQIDAQDHRAHVLGRLTVRELAIDPGVELGRIRLARARRATGAVFDELVFAVLSERWPKPVAAFELRERVGGPRWKVQASLGRLVAKRRVARKGKTSGVRYTAMKK